MIQCLVNDMYEEIEVHEEFACIFLDLGQH
jgi:hypothetical protein